MTSDLCPRDPRVTPVALGVSNLKFSTTGRRKNSRLMRVQGGDEGGGGGGSGRNFLLDVSD